VCTVSGDRSNIVKASKLGRGSKEWRIKVYTRRLYSKTFLKRTPYILETWTNGK